MANYLLVYSGGSMPDTDEEKAKVMQAWTSWFEKLGAAVVDGGNPTTGKAKTINSDMSVVDGPVDMVSGYSVIKADSLEAAVEMTKTCPILMGGAKVMVFETFNVM